MKTSNLDKHNVQNCLLRLRSILECIEMEGESFVTEKVSTDVDEALETIRKEFLKISKGKPNDNI